MSLPPLWHVLLYVTMYRATTSQQLLYLRDLTCVSCTCSQLKAPLEMEATLSNLDPLGILEP
jgi:hypothetical protein